MTLLQALSFSRYAAVGSCRSVRRLARVVRSIRQNSLTLFTLLILLIIVSALPIAARAHTLSLTDNNSTIIIDPHSSAGFFSWVVDGIPHLNQEWSWLRFGGAAFESPVSSLFLVTDTILPGVPEIFMVWQDIPIPPPPIPPPVPGLVVIASYSLIGGPPGSGISQVQQKYGFTRPTGPVPPLSLTWFVYADFNLTGTAADDTASGGVSGIAQQDGATLAAVTPVLLVSPLQAFPGPQANAFQIAAFSTIRDSFNDGGITNLNNTGSPFGPGNATFAFQWDLSLSAGETINLSIVKDLVPVPTPNTLLLLGAGLAGLAWSGWRRRRKGCSM